jgi:hypothetical protein
MKKLLLLSLFLLIALCIYFKAPTLYNLKYPQAEKPTETPTPTVVEKSQAQEKEKIKEEPSTPPTPKAPPSLETTPPTPPTPTIEKKEPTPQPIEEALIKNSPLLQEVKKSIDEKLKYKKSDHITPQESAEILKKAIKKVVKEDKKASLPTEQEKRAVVELLVDRLSEQTRALKDRDEAIKALNRMIERALEDRRKVIAYRTKLLEDLENDQNRLIKERNAITYQPNREKKGE